MSPTSKPSQLLYFAYGSNLSTTQMSARCPFSTFHSLGFLPAWAWMINERGYANIIPLSAPLSSALEATEKQEGVWGLLYQLDDVDEESLDLYEGVPDAYTKEFHSVQIHASMPGPSCDSEPESREVLVYVDRLRTKEGVPREEYVGRMRRGIREAEEKGLSREWAEGVMGRFLGYDGVRSEGREG